MSIPQLDVDLKLPPRERWAGLALHAAAARELMAYYNRDIGGTDSFGDLLVEYRDAAVERAYADEMTAIAGLLAAPEQDVLLANFYYDALKVVLGCTAFAVDGPAGPLHGRNLDWGTADHVLARHSILINYRWGAELRYRVVGWPGYIGALSGIRPGAFSVTLNAVLSDDKPELLPPVTLLLRTVLAESADFADALRRLAASPIACDCLLLLVGAEPGQMAVVERTPTRSGLRAAEDGVLVVTNDYRCSTAAASTTSSSELARTSCGRYDRARALLFEKRPETLEDCYRVLHDPGVRMKITMQSMAFRPRTGEWSVRIPSGGGPSPTSYSSMK